MPILIYLSAACLCLWLSGCTTTRTMMQERVVRDTVRMRTVDTLRTTAVRSDSVFIRDSVYFEGRVRVKERLRERWRIRVDTVWKVRELQRREAVHADTKRHEKRRDGYLSPLGGFAFAAAVIGIVFFFTRRIR